MVNLLEASIKVSRCSRHNGFDEERLLPVALLITPNDAEAPALVVGLLQDDVPAPVHVTEETSQSQLFHIKQKQLKQHYDCDINDYTELALPW